MLHSWILQLWLHCIIAGLQRLAKRSHCATNLADTAQPTLQICWDIWNRPKQKLRSFTEIHDRARTGLQLRSSFADLYSSHHSLVCLRPGWWRGGEWRGCVCRADFILSHHRTRRPMTRDITQDRDCNNYTIVSTYLLPFHCECECLEGLINAKLTSSAYPFTWFLTSHIL